MLRACVAGWRSPEADLVHSRLSGRPDFRIPPVRSTGVEVVETLRSDPVDVLLLPMDWVDVARAIKKDIVPALTDTPSIVLIAHAPRLSTRARALASGFDGVVDLEDDIEVVVTALHRITNSSSADENDFMVSDLGIIPDLLARNLSLIDQHDSELLDLLAIGTTDEEIALAMEWNIQQVRNRVAALLDANGLRYRTQLAVAHVSSARIPDFIRPIFE
jgi:DNA-binding NarL/FixJ family response regulator